MPLPPRPTLKFSAIRDRKPKARVSQIGKASVKMGVFTFEWLIFRRGTKGRVTIGRKGKFKPRVKRWARTTTGRLRKIEVSLGNVELSYDVGHGTRRYVIELIDRGPKSVRGRKSTRYSLVHTLYSGRTRLSKKTKYIGNYRDANTHVNDEVKSLKESLSRKPSYHIVKPTQFGLVIPKTQVPKYTQGYDSIAAVKREIRSRFNDMTIEFAHMRIAYADHKATRPPTVLSKFKYLPKYYIRRVKKLQIGGYPVEIRSFTKRVERAPTRMAEHILYKLLRWRVTRKYSGRTRSRWKEVGWLLLRWGYGRGHGRFVPTYTVINPKGKEIDFRVPLTPKESEKMAKEKSKLRGINFVRKPVQAARNYIEKDMEKWFKHIEKEYERGLKREPDYYQKGRKESTERFGNIRVKIIRYGFLKKPVGKTKGARIIGGLMVKKYRKGTRKPLKTWHWQLMKETKKGGKYVVSESGAVQKRFKMKRTAKRLMVSQAELRIDTIRADALK